MFCTLKSPPPLTTRMFPAAYTTSSSTCSFCTCVFSARPFARVSAPTYPIPLSPPPANDTAAGRDEALWKKGTQCRGRGGWRKAKAVASFTVWMAWAVYPHVSHSRGLGYIEKHPEKNQLIIYKKLRKKTVTLCHIHSLLQQRISASCFFKLYLIVGRKRKMEFSTAGPLIVTSLKMT